MDELLDIFICYAGPDRDVAVALKAELEALGHSAWVDHTDLVPGDRWAEVIDEKLHAASMVAVLVSRAWGTHKTLYAPEEAARALDRVRHEPVRVVPIKLDDIRGRELHYGLSQLVHIEAFDRRMAPVAKRLSAALDDRAAQPETIGGYLEPPASADPIDAAVTEAEASLRELRTSGAPAPVIASTQENVLRLKRTRLHGLQPAVGQILCKRWHLVELLGKGGFAEVWKAWDAKTRSDVAVKLLHGQFSTSAERQQRFFRGARQMARLDHPGVVRVIQGRARDLGWHFFVMEYLPGGDLMRAVLGGLDGRRALRCVIEVADALAVAHASGLVHRDVKPANILLDGAGHARLTDFDLVRAGDTTGGTRTGALGTFVYAAPEALDDAARVTAASDIYGLGMTAAFALLGRKLGQRMLRFPERVLGNVKGFAAVKREILKAIDWEPDARHESAAAFAAALQRALSPTPGMVMAEVTGHRPALVYIPPGRFMMGSPESEEGRDDDERLHPVVLSEPLLMARTPVTERQYRALVRMGSRRSAQPVTEVSWYDAVAFCNTLSEREGLTPALRGEGDTIEIVPGADGYRLPTEAEWEYACRAGTTTRFWSGNTGENLGRVGWYAGNSRSQTQPVAQKPPNPWGLFDMHGDVFEWCHDWFGIYPRPRTTDSPRISPPGPPHGEFRVMRGGSCGVTARRSRSAFRNRGDPGFQNPRVGFRLVRTPRAP